MQKKIHPKYYNDAKVTCACGTTFTTGSVLPEIKVEICSACHPFYTGEQKYIDTLGRVERFRQKQASMAKTKFVKKSERKKLKNKEEDKKTPKTLKEMLQK